jgi:hypothetical protein
MRMEYCPARSPFNASSRLRPRERCHTASQRRAHCARVLFRQRPLTQASRELLSLQLFVKPKAFIGFCRRTRCGVAIDMLRRLILYIFGAAVSLCILYLIFLALRDHTVLTLVVAHCIFGFASLLFTLAGIKKIRADAPVLLTLVEKRNYVLDSISFAAVFFGGLSTVLVIASSALIAGRAPLKNSFKLSASARLSNAVLTPAISSAIYLIAVYFVAFLNPDKINMLRIITGSVLLSILLRHVTYIMSGSSVRSAMRKTSGNVYVLFAILSSCDLLSITLGSNSFLNWHNSIFSVSDLYAVLIGLILGNFVDIFKYVINRSPPPPDIVVFAVVGAIFNATIVDGIYKIREFTRNDDDYIAIGMNLIQIGKYAEAIEVLRKAQKKTFGFLICRAAAYMGLAKFDLAWRDVQSAKDPSNEETDHPLPDDMRVGFALGGILSAIAIDDTTVCQYIAYCTHRSLDDVIIASTIEGVYMPRRPIGDIANLIPKELCNSSRPLCSTACALLVNDIDSARQSLIDIRPASIYERMMYFRFALLVVTIEHKDSMNGATQAYESLSDVIFRHTSDIKIVSCNMYEKGVLYTTAITFREVGRILESKYQERWQYTINELSVDPAVSNNAIFLNISRNLK